MKECERRFAKYILLSTAFFSTALIPTAAPAQVTWVDFESDRWELQNAQVTEHLGRKCLAGTGFLRDVEFENGIIEVDLAVDGMPAFPCVGVRSYPGIVWRMQSDDNYERFYVRPHRAPVYSDALQYVPTFNGIGGWQLYSGEGFTAGTNDFPANEWVHLRMEVLGTQARLFINNAEEPALVINDLKHGVSSGGVGVMGMGPRIAYFSNFKYTPTDDLDFDPPPKVEERPGVITNWEISEAFPISGDDVKEYPGKQRLSDLKWDYAQSEPTGLLDVARYRSRTGRQADAVYARTTIRAEKDRTMDLTFGYSDAVSIFLNGKILFFGNSAYQLRDPSFLGIVGPFDAVFLPLEKGENEILLMVAEGFGGWGFMCQDGEATFEAKGINKKWETARDFKTPEAIVYDSDRRVLYVSNFDQFGMGAGQGKQFISKIGLDGKVKELEWVTGVTNPTGMTIHEDKLFVVERGALVEIDLDSGEIIERHAIPGSQFPNDVAFDGSGAAYVSDSRRSAIHRFAGGQWEVWLEGGEIADPNGLLTDGDRLLVLNNGDSFVKAVNLKTKEVTSFVRIPGGILDGIALDRDDNYLVSHWQGRLYRVTPSGEVTKLLDTSVPEMYIADFGYIAKKDMVLAPGFYRDRVMAYEIK